MKKNNIILIGPPGVGKSFIGQNLAHILGRNFYDTDNEVVKLSGKNIEELFSIYGEQYFRGIEEKVIANMESLEFSIIATGGGSVVVENNRNNLSKLGKIVYLTASISTLVNRILKDNNRPMFENLSLAEAQIKLIKLVNSRSLFYQSIADLVIDIDNVKFSSKY